MRDVLAYMHSEHASKAQEARRGEVPIQYMHAERVCVGLAGWLWCVPGALSTCWGVPAVGVHFGKA